MKTSVCLMVAALSLAVALPSFAKSRADSAEDMRQQLAAMATVHSKNGGLATKPGKGRFAIVSAQKLYSKEDLAQYVKRYSSQFKFPIECLEAEGAISAANANERRNSLNANVVVFLVDDPAQPMSLVAIEERWAIINVGKVTEKGVEKRVNDKRLQCEFSRIFKAIFCGAEKEKDRPAVSKSADFDLITVDPIDANSLFGIINGLGSFGLVAARTVPYRRACREGWAPQPTNDVQKAIWKEVHELPTEPLKIKKQK